MPSDQDLFSEEKEMVAMSFGDHIEELRMRLVLALLGLAVGVALTFIPGVSLGARVLRKMQDPAQEALTEFYTVQAKKRSEAADAKKETTGPFHAQVDLAELAEIMRRIAPQADIPAASKLEGKTAPLTLRYLRSEQILSIAENARPVNALVSLAPLEGFMIYFMVCLVTGLVISSPWVFYQLWEFVAAGLYRHERHYVLKFLPFSLGLFLGGVFLCFFYVLPYTLQFLLGFNVWLGIEPTLRISEWINFATILPLVFGLCFQTPLVMLIVERLGILSVNDFREKRKMAILAMVVIAALITPTTDPLSLSLLAVPMLLLYELGIMLMVRKNIAPKATVEL
jgi:sec-independent protein translocase protein TatC